jgi:DNA-binding NarL/FixJ family response regulator
LTTVFVVAPAPALRAGLAAMLEQAGMSVAGAAGGIPAELAADVLLLAGLPLDDVEELPGPTLLLSDDSRQAVLLQSLGLTGWGALPPDAGADQLAAGVQAVAEGLAVMPAGSAAPSVTKPPVEVSDPLQEPLTPRELEVLQLVSQGLPNKLIARRLGISEHTVKFHVSSTYAKLGAASRTEAVSLAARRGLISL